jgi:hypothetical protein
MGSSFSFIMPKASSSATLSAADGMPISPGQLCQCGVADMAALVHLGNSGYVALISRREKLGLQ